METLSIVATYISLLLLFQIITIPPMLESTITAFSGCTNSLTLFFVGTIFANIGFKGMLSKENINFCMLRMITFPLVVFLLLTLMKLDPLWVGMITLLAATPAGSTTSILASQYNYDQTIAARLVVSSTALSMIMIPIWSVFLVYRLG